MYVLSVNKTSLGAFFWCCSSFIAMHLCNNSELKECGRKSIETFYFSINIVTEQSAHKNKKNSNNFCQKTCLESTGFPFIYINIKICNNKNETFT